jgi:hypothetical protein
MHADLADFYSITILVIECVLLSATCCLARLREAIIQSQRERGSWRVQRGRDTRGFAAQIIRRWLQKSYYAAA